MTVAGTILVRDGILVAHDGSEESGSALRMAVRCAPGFGNRVHVVRAWSVITAPTPPDSTTGWVPGLDAFEAATQADLDEAVDAVRAEGGAVVISTSVVHGNAAQVFIEASDRVDLIVMGSRGRGGFAGLLLGSTSAQVVQHARCGVLVDRGAYRSGPPTIEQGLGECGTR